MKKAYLIVVSIIVIVGIMYYNNQRNSDLNKLMTLEEDSSIGSQNTAENFSESTPANPSPTSQSPESNPAESTAAFQSPNTAPEIEQLIDSCLGLYFRMDQEIAEMSINELLTVFEDNLGELGERKLISETTSDRSNSEVYAIQVGENESLRVSSEDGIPVELRMEKDGKQFRCLTVDGYASCACSPQMK